MQNHHILFVRQEVQGVQYKAAIYVKLLLHLMLGLFRGKHI